MLSKNLQELTDKIYQEGVEKAKQEGGSILDQAKQEAQAIITKAEKQAKSILEKAEKSAEEIRKNNEAEMKLAAQQAMSALKQKIADLVIADAVAKPLETTFKDQQFLQSIIEKMISHWINDQEGGDDPRVILPKEDFDKLQSYFESREKDLLNQGVQLNFEGKMKDGFAIGPQDGRYKISFTSEDFENYFKSFMRPRSFELLFGSGA